MNKYGIYIPSKARSDRCLTADFLDRWNIPFTVVAEPQDLQDYRQKYPSVLSLDQNNMGLSYARNWIKNYSEAKGDEYHWQLDDDIKKLQVREGSHNTDIEPSIIFTEVEKYIREYPNVSVAGLRDSVYAWTQKDFISVNKVVASAFIVKNDTPMLWRSNMIEDMAYCLDSLLRNYCTVIFNRYLYYKAPNNSGKGGQLEVNTRYRELQLNLVRTFPYAFVISENKNGKMSVRSSKVWRSFTQRPQ